MNNFNANSWNLLVNPNMHFLVNKEKNPATFLSYFNHLLYYCRFRNKVPEPISDFTYKSGLRAPALPLPDSAKVTIASPGVLPFMSLGEGYNPKPGVSLSWVYIRFLMLF